MNLYHGSNVAVRIPRIIKTDRRLDFGTGFYLTSSFSQAERWAQLTFQRRKDGGAVVSIFEIDESRFKDLKVLHFHSADRNWLEYVSANRKNIAIPDNDYDIVFGPVANDKTMPVINLFFSGIYDIEEALKRLLPQKLDNQYAFKTEQGLRLLDFKGTEKL